MPIAYTQPGVWPVLSEGRFATSIRVDSPERCSMALLGFPDDTGIGLNHGRLGARLGPGAFRQALGKFGTAWDGLADQRLDLEIYDAGDIEPAPGDDEYALFETHRRVEAAVAELRQLGLVTVGVGGGHDLSLPALTAVSRHAGVALAGVNLDAHLDVRERVGSGMPFRQLIEGGYLDPHHFLELGLGRFANEERDVKWLRERGARFIYADEVSRSGFALETEVAGQLGHDAAFVSIDLDGLDQSAAPGVSAPNPQGLGVDVAARLAESAGRAPSVSYFDIMEFNPSHDPQGHTGRVAALLFLHFVAGLKRRGS